MTDPLPYALQMSHKQAEVFQRLYTNQNVTYPISGTVSEVKFRVDESDVQSLVSIVNILFSPVPKRYPEEPSLN